MTSNIEAKLAPLIEALQAGSKITFFLGAGISTSAGIPDFRSPETGLYANLAKLNLPFAEAVFDIDYFKELPQAFYTLAGDLYPGKFKPTVFHHFLKLVQDKGLLQRVYTQNIDTLERIAGVEEKYIVEAHGSFAYNHCIDCSQEMSVEELKNQMENGGTAVGIPVCGSCGGYVKPDIVFFGEGLPARFFEMWDEDCDEVDVAIVAGTSLTVHPFALLPSEVAEDGTLRVLINKEAVGDFEETYRRETDILALNSCDSVARSICRLLDWESQLDSLILEWDERQTGDVSKQVAKDIETETVKGKKDAEVKKEKEEEKEEKGEEEKEEKDTTEDKKEVREKTKSDLAGAEKPDSDSDEDVFADAVSKLKI